MVKLGGEHCKGEQREDVTWSMYYKHDYYEVFRRRLIFEDIEYINTHIHVHIIIHTYACMHGCIHTCVHAHTHTHTHTHT